MAMFPANAPCSPALAALCEQALGLRLPMTRNGELCALVEPLIFNDDLFGVAALRFSSPNLPMGVGQWLRWGAGWLAERARRQEKPELESLQERLLATLDLVAAGLDEVHGDAACQAVATELAVRLECDRVSIGFGDRKGVKLAALSHSADFSRRLDLVQGIEAAMNEAADQGEPIHFEAPGDGEPDGLLIRREHEALSHTYGSAAILSVPVFFDERDVAVFSFEWPETIEDPVTMQLASGLPAVLARLLRDKRLADRGLLQLLADGAAVEIRRLFGPRHAARKIGLLLTLCLVAFCYLARGEFRISAEAALEGRIRQVVASPYDGFVADAEARAGQVVKQGDLLALLDDRDMKLESSRWASQEAQYLKQAHDAEAQHNLAQLQIARAQAQQAEAQRLLSDAMARRSRVVAPIDGVITSGDLSQQLGSAVRKGQTLFEVAPLDSYRVVLKVEERDIAYLDQGQKGGLVVTALPGVSFPYTVTLITPVAEAREGKNYFRVEAALDEPGVQLRPGMEGVGKILIGEHRLVWIWIRHFRDWLRLQLWSWLGV
jgi:RND family efflux transporter MFP subunit